MENDGFGLAGLIFGIFSILAALTIIGFPFSVIFGILGIIFALKQKKIHQTGIAKTGLILSIVGIALAFFILLLVIFRIVYWASLYY
jgi:hypothetical protein